MHIAENSGGPSEASQHPALGGPAPAPGRKTAHREKLWPAWWLWIAAVIIGASVSLIFFPIDVTFGVLSMVAGIGLLLFALVVTTPSIEIRHGVLSAGRARISTDHIGQVVAHRGAAAREQLGPGFDARSYQCIRGWIDPVITVEITDPEDATPYWIFSTRNPEAVLEALGSKQPIRNRGISVQE